MNQIKILEKTWKVGIATFVSAVLVFGGLFLNLNSTSASESPNLTVRMLANDDNDSPDAGWQHSLDSEAGHQISFGVEIHNTVVGTEAENVHVEVGLPDDFENTLNIPVFVSADNANDASDSVSINITNPSGGAKAHFVSHSTRLYWDTNGDGVKEFNNTPLVDGIVDGGLTLGNQKGCNNYIIQVTFLVELEGGDEPEPSPTPEATPTATTGGNTNINENTNNNDVNVHIENSNEQHQEMKVVNPAVQVEAAKAPIKQPETGVGVLGVATMAGAAPVGVILSRFGRGRIASKREESLEEVANEVFKGRSDKIAS